MIDYFKDERWLGGMGGRQNAVSISNNDVILRSEGGGGRKTGITPMGFGYPQCRLLFTLLPTGMR